ncbi:MAG: UvrD-helicase domain-containing protein [Acidimicrobiales bacterium]
MENLLAGLTEHQRLAVTTDSARLLIVAGAGSGKTRVLTRRIAHGAMAHKLEPEHTLALTFTRKAARELRVRLGKLGLTNSVSAGTFHAQAYAQLRSRWADHGTRPPELIDSRPRLVYRIAPRSMKKTERQQLNAEIDWASARRVSPEAYIEEATSQGRNPAVGVDEVARLYQRYRDEKRNKRLVDFDDLLELCIRDMADAEYAATRHWRFRSLFVDEFQDVNRLQFDLLCAWLGPDSSLCVVGDPNQAIYTWNGADSSYLANFSSHFAGATSVELTDNFRSSPQILGAAAAVLGRREPMRATRPDGPIPSVRRCADEHAEATSIARKVRDCHNPGGRWSHQAVLVRTNAQTTAIAEALRAAQVPIAIKDGSSILDNAAVNDRLHELGQTEAPLAVALADLRLDARSEVDNDTREALEALVALAEDQVSINENSTTTEFLAWVRATLSNESNSGTVDAVDIMTFHAAKGLEWHVVHLAGLEDGLVPLARAVTPEAASEEVRLLYVAITRAQQSVHCSWAARRRFGERYVDRKPSRLLDPITGRSTEPKSTDPKRNASRARQIRRELGSTTLDAGDASVRDNIREWRRITARSAGVPAYVVFGDRTLDALAASRPSTHDELQQVPGLGPVKVARYGDDLLDLIAQG